MNDLPRQNLCKIIARHGQSIASEPRRLAALLRDYNPSYRREIAVLVSAAEEGVARELLARTGLPREALLARLTRRLHENVAMEITAAQWAVNSWALALSVLSTAELEHIKQDHSATVAAPVPPAITQTGQQRVPRNSSNEIIVSAWGDGDFTTLGEALNAATPDARVRVRAGVYHEGIVLNKPVEIIAETKNGVGQEVVIVNAVASCLQMQTSAATVRGLTLRQEPSALGDEFFAVDIPQGRLLLEDCNVSSDSLSCIGIHNDSAAPIIRRCRVHSSKYAGVYFFDAASGFLDECDIYGNTNMGIAITTHANPTLKRCKIHDGENAGVVSWEGGLGVLEECEIFGNGKAGIGVSEAAELSIRHCQIYGGSNSGIFVHHNGQVLVEGCHIHGHAAPEVAVSHKGKFIARECKIYEGRTSGVFIDLGGVAVLEDCDLQGNAGTGIVIHDEGVAALSQCRINHNGGVAISVKKGGEIIAENCDLRGNRLGAWEVDPETVVKDLGNLS
jgi:parallel beta-helix repeat protein